MRVHLEHVTHRKSQRRSVAPPRTHRALRNDDIVLLGEPVDDDDRRVDERVILDLSVERLLALQMERARTGSARGRTP